MAKPKKITKKSPAKKPVKKAPAKKSAKTASTKTKKKIVVKGKKTVAIKGRASKKPARTAKRTIGTKRARITKTTRNVNLKPLAENDAGRKFADSLGSAILDKKGTDVAILDVRRNAANVGYDYILLATGDSQPQLSAMEEAVRTKAKAENRKALVEESPEWVLMNFDDVVVHFFTPEKRSLYDLDGLWSDVPRFEVKA